MTLDSRTSTRMLWFTLGGFCFGALVAVVNTVSADHPPLVALSQVLGVGWSWAAVGILAGAQAVRQSALAAIVTLLLAVVGYYLVDLWNGVYTHLDRDHPLYDTDPTQAPVITSWDGLIGDMTYWGVAAIFFGLVLGPVGRTAHRPDKWGLLCRLAVPVGAAVEMFVLRLPAELQLQPRPVAAVTMAAVGLIGVIVAMVLCFHHLKTRSRNPKGPIANHPR